MFSMHGPDGGVENRGTWQTLMYWKTMFDRCYCVISTKCSVTFAKNVALYFVTFDSQHLSAPFY